MSTPFTGTYQDWQGIDYRPVVETLKPTTLLEYLKPGNHVLDVGCNSGEEALFLARHNIHVLGLDINQPAIEIASYRATRDGLSSLVRFEVGNFLNFRLSQQFDAVLFIRVLTCIPSADEWQSMLRQAWLQIADNGLLYVRDFLFDPDNPAYAERYAAAAKLGSRDGNFLVTDKRGEPLFVAHHHSEHEIQFLIAPYQSIAYCTGDSLSMNGNVCRMFEFVGRKINSTYPELRREDPSALFSKNVIQPRGSSPVSIIHDSKPDWITQHLSRAESPTEIKTAARNIERQFSLQFDSFTIFPALTLAALRNLPDASTIFESDVIVASNYDPEILRLIDSLTRIANTAHISIEDRRRYWNALVLIYSQLPFQPSTYHDDPETLFVGIQREGFLLAKAMGCMPASHSIAPHAKRIHFENGLVVGLSGLPDLQHYRQCIIIDGAIASGATIIALIEQLQTNVRSFRIFSAHATAEGCRSILNFARLTGLEVKIVVGHVTQGLDDHFYATLPEDSSQLVVGDLGDTISELGR